MEISYDYYKIFYYVAKYGSISSAANVLLRGQPNVSKTVSLLEAQIGRKLLVRSNRGVSLTPDGEKLYSHLQKAFEEISEAESEIAVDITTDNKVLSIATTEIALYGSVLSSLSEFAKDHPHIKVRLTNSNNTHALEMLKKGLADFAVLTAHDIDGKGFSYTKIKDFKEILCCKSGSVQSTDPNYVIERYPFVSLEKGTTYYSSCMDKLKALGISKNPDIEVATASQILQIIRAGIGIGFLPEPIASEYLENGSIEEISFKKEPSTRGIYLVEDKKQTLGITAKAFVKYLK